MSFMFLQLKLFTPNYTLVFVKLPRPPDLMTSDNKQAEILERCMVKHGDKALVELHVHWSSSPTITTTWEDYDTLRRRFPTATIWQDGSTTSCEAHSEEERSVTPASFDDVVD